MLHRAGLETPELDARLLVQEATGIREMELLEGLERPIQIRQRALLESLVRRRLAGAPVSRLRGVREFYGLSFELPEGVFDPRPESETLVEVGVEIAREGSVVRVLDLGCGTGCLLMALMHTVQGLCGIGVDCAPQAITAARRNARRLGCSALFVQGHWGEALRGPFDLILSNPPYIPSGDIAQLPREVRLHDPHRALDGGADGLEAYRILAFQGHRLLGPGGWLALEVGAGQREGVRGVLQQAGLKVVGERCDLAGIPRVLWAVKRLANPHI